MKKTILFVLLFAPFLVVQGQKADIDNYKIKVKYASLPKNYIEPDQRTFDVTGPNSDEVKIYGWTRDLDNPSLRGKVSMSRFTIGDGAIDKKVTKKTNKEGKVTSTKTTYAVKSTSSGNGRISVYGPKNELMSERQKAKAAKKAAKKASKKKKKKKEEKVEDNPFLSGVDATQSADEDPEEDAKRVYFSFFSQKYEYNTAYKTTSKAAWSEFKGNKNSRANDHEESFDDYTGSFASNYLNSRYGYAPKTANVRFLILDSKKHPEYEMYQQAMGALKVILGKTAYNKTNDQVLTDAAPIIDYLTKLTEKYTEDKKHPKRVRKSAYYNLAQFYLYMDNTEKCKEMAQALIDTELDKNSGKKFIEQAEDIAEFLAFHKMESRHLLNAEDAEGEEVIEEEEEEGGNE